MKRFLLFMLPFASLMVTAQSGHLSYLSDKTAYREHALDITHMKVEVKFDPLKGKVFGKVTHRFLVLQKQVDSVFFDAPAINIKSAQLNGAALNYTSVKTGVWVKPAKPLSWDQTGTIVFEYEATPQRGIYFIGWKDTVGIDGSNPFATRKQIWTQGQGIDNRHWIPMYDDMNDKFVTETEITFHSDYQVLSNGPLIKKTKNKDNTTTWHYSMSKPHAGYLLMIAIGQYAVKSSKTRNGVQLNNWYYPEFADRAEPTYRYTADMMDFLEKETGIPYPWESYSQVMVQGFIYGAMENTTATIFGDFFNTDERAFLDRNYIGVNCHEMTHQWFGDYITARDGRDSWLQESFATYWPKQFSKVNEGIEEWDWQRRSHQNSAIEAGKKDNYPVRHSMGGTARNYPKGAAVISMMEYVLGDDQWKRALNHYLKTHAYANVEANDLKQAIQDKLGIDLSWFFDEWIYRGGEPHYRVHYEALTYAGGKQGTEVAIEQIHKTDETVRWFNMPIAVEVHYTDGSFDKAVEQVDEQFEVIKIDNPGNRQIAFVLFDPNSNIIKQVTFNKGFNELKAQASGASNYLDRYDAVVAMKELSLDQKRSVLLDRLSKEKHHGIIIEIVNQLIADKDPTTVAALQGLAGNRALRSNIRESVIKGLKYTNDQWKALMLNGLADPSYDVVKASMEQLLFFNFDESTIGTIYDRTKGVLGMHNTIELKRQEMRILAGRMFNAYAGSMREASGIIVAFASPRYEFRTRLLAFNTLKSLNWCDAEVAKCIFSAMLSSNARLAGPATQLAEHFGIQTTARQILQKQFNTGGYSDPEKETLKKQLNFL